MKLLIVSAVMLSFAVVTTGRIIKNVRRRKFWGKGTRLPVFILLSAALIMLSYVLAFDKGLSFYVLTAELMPSVTALWIMTSFMSEKVPARRWAYAALIMNSFSVVYNFCMVADLCGNMDDRHAVFVSSMVLMGVICIYVWWLSRRMGRVKELMGFSTVWTVVCLTVDLVYACFMTAGLAIMQIGWDGLGTVVHGSVLSALAVRVLTDSKFLIWRRQETLIVESMKLAAAPSAADPEKIEEVYKELYDRVVAYFETRKPFLDSDLTINSVVKDMYSNKLYISKAISRFTGRNFCQFVNYYRVMYSMECFRENQETKVHELASMSGFNSVVSYNMAFRLFMGENPSEWCRRERGRLMRARKSK